MFLMAWISSSGLPSHSINSYDLSWLVQSPTVRHQPIWFRVTGSWSGIVRQVSCTFSEYAPTHAPHWLYGGCQLLIYGWCQNISYQVSNRKWTKLKLIYKNLMNNLSLKEEEVKWVRKRNSGRRREEWFMV